LDQTVWNFFWFTSLANNNLELAGDLDCKLYYLIFRSTQRVY